MSDSNIRGTFGAEDVAHAVPLEQSHREEAFWKADKAKSEAAMASADAAASHTRLNNESWKIRSEICKNVGSLAIAACGAWVAYLGYRLKADQR